MAGPLAQQTVRYLIPPGEAQRVYAPGSLAQEVRNFVVTDEHTLRAVRGPCPYETKDTSAYGVNMPGLFHAALDGGTADMLLLRSGPNMYRHAGWSRSWEQIHTGISDDERPAFPDQFVVIGNRIVWTNGVDRPQVVSADGSVHALGFQSVPPTPVADGPNPPAYTKKLLMGSNAEGYSAFGRIGTTSQGLAATEHLNIGGISGISAEFEATSGKQTKYAGIVDRIVGAKYYYYLQWEDVHGNLSAPSSRSNGVRIYQARTFPNLGVNIEDITRQLLVRFGGEAPENAVAARIYRTPDVKNISAVPQLLARVPGTGQAIYPDNVPDSELGAPMKSYTTVPLFKVMTAYQGRLVVANSPGEEGTVRVSEPGFPGTFESHMYAVPDSGGAEITGLASHGGALYAFTRSSMYSLEILPDGIVFRPLTTGIGCVAPKSICGTQDGSLIWLGQEGFYRMQGGAIADISAPISKTVRTRLNDVRMKTATAVTDPNTGEYRCAVTLAGKNKNTVMLCFGETGWRRVDLGIEIGDMCVTDDSRRYTLFTGVETAWADGGASAQAEGASTPEENVSTPGVPTAPAEGRARVFVFDREYPGDHEPAGVVLPGLVPTGRTGPGVLYRSAWFRADEVGLMRFNVRMVYLGMLDSAADTPITVRFFKNGRWDPVTTIDDVLSTGVHVTPAAGAATMSNTTKLTDRRPFWRKVNPDLKNVDTWAFEIEATRESRLRLQGFAFDIATVGKGTPHGRVPRGDDK